MTKDNLDRYDLSRRKVLGGLTAVGVASVGAGLGTSAYFSDDETFENNVLTAGSLDLKVDWEEHYSDWSPDEEEGLQNEVVMTENDPGNVPADYVGLPDPAAPLIAVHMDDLATFMNNTSIEAFPDYDDDGVQDDTVDGETRYDPCVHGADTPDDLDALAEGALRTQSQDTVNEDEEPKPLIALEDVKPGDFGELTLSFHLCNNPGYVWMQGGNVEWSENGVTEPESQDPDEVEGEVELMDTIQTVWWYDDGDNVLEGGDGAPICAQLVLDSSGSMTATDGDGVSRQEEMKDGATQLANAILGAGPDNRVGVTEFDSDANLLLSVGSAGSQDATQVQNAIDSVDASGGTAIDTGIDTANGDLAECPEGTRTVMIVVTDGQNNDGVGPVQTASDDAIASNTGEIFAVGTGGATQATLEAIANPDDDAHIVNTTDLTNAIANLSATVLGEKVIFRGSLADSLGALQSGNGIPLDGNRVTGFNELADDPTADSRECFNAEDTHYVGFAWYLPVDHANEIQTDSVEFDLGFYTEQCRHNTGAGMEPEATPTPTPTNDT